MLLNDTDVDGDFLKVAAVNGMTTNVGQPLTLGSGAILTLAEDGTLSYSAAASFVGADTFQYTVSDGVLTSIATATVQVSADQLNFPTLTAQQNADGDTISFLVSASDLTGDPLTFTAVGLPDGLSINPSTGQITGTIPAGSINLAGPERVVVTVSDGVNAASREFLWTVSTRISVAAVAGQQGTEGDSVSLQITASIPGGTALTYDAIGLPAGLSIGATTGLIAGTLAPGSATDPSTLMTVTATDGVYNGTVSFLWTVAPRIDLPTIPDKTGVLGDSVSLVVAASIPGGAALNYSASGLPAGLSINSATGVISGTLSTATQGNPNEVTVTVTSGAYSAVRQFRWVVNTRVIAGGLTAVTDTYAVRQGPFLDVAGSPTGWPSLLENDSASDGDPLSISAVNGVTSAVGQEIALSSGAKLTVFADGRFGYEVAANFLGVDSFTYTVTNGLVSAVVTAFVKLQQQGMFHLDEVVDESFDNWKVDTKITLAKVNALIETGPSMDSKYVAALAFLKLYVLDNLGGAQVVERHRAPFGGLDATGLTRKNLQQFATYRKQDPNTVKDAKIRALVIQARHLDAIYQNLVKRADELRDPIASTKPKDMVWGTMDTTEKLANAIKQGRLGDCVFLSGLINTVRSSTVADLKARIKGGLFNQGNRREYEVLLYDDKGKPKWVKVELPTRGQRIIYGGDDGRHAVGDSLRGGLHQDARG